MDRGLLVLALVALAALLATLPAVDGSFVYDDAVYLVENPAVAGEASPWSTSLGDPRQALWRPLTVLSWKLQWDGPHRAAPLLWGNVLLHVLVSVLVVLLGRRLGAGAAGAAVAGLLFAVHPVHAEAVGWVTGRAELLAAALVLGAWLAYLREGAGAVALSCVALAMAGLSKENALAAPALFAVADLWRGRRPLPWGRLALLGVTAVGVFALRTTVLPEALPQDGPFLDTPLAGRAVVALNVLGYALRLLVWPEPLRIEYQRDEFTTLRPEAALAGLLLAVVVWRARDRRLPALGLALTAVALAPVSHLLPIGEPFAERFLYLPSVGFCLAAGAALEALGRREKAAGSGLGLSAGVVLVAATLGLLGSRAAVAVLRDDLSLWRHAARVAPRLALTHYNLGSHLHQSGHHVTLDRDEPGCTDALRTSLELEPRHLFAPFAHQVLGVHALEGAPHAPSDPWTAADHFREALDQMPVLVEPRLNLAAIAASSPDIVPRHEATALLRPVLESPNVSLEQRAAAEELLLQVSSSGAAGVSPSGGATEATGTSSPEGS